MTGAGSSLATALLAFQADPPEGPELRPEWRELLDWFAVTVVFAVVLLIALPR